jgi:hypothetical protein
LVVLVVARLMLLRMSGSVVVARAPPVAEAALPAVAGAVPVAVNVSVWPGARLGAVQVVPVSLVPKMVTVLVTPPVLTLTPVSPEVARIAVRLDAGAGPLSVTVKV